MPDTRSIGVAGTGRMAQALGRLLAEAGCRVAAVAGRDPARTEAAARFAGTRPAALAELPRLASRLLIAVSDGAAHGQRPRAPRRGRIIVRPHPRGAAIEEVVPCCARPA